MGNSHPTISVSYSSPLSSEEIMRQIGSISTINENYTVQDTWKESIDLLYITPGCGWFDKIHLELKCNNEETEIIVR